MNFGQILKSYRQWKGLTQREFVRSIRAVDRDYEHIDVVSYHRWEHGKVTPSPKKQAVLLDSLGLNKCARSLFIPDIKKVSAYLDDRYKADKAPLYALGMGQKVISQEIFGSNNEFPEFVLDMQNRVFDIAEPKFFLNYINKYASESCLYVYFNENHSTLGHLLFYVLEANKFKHLLPITTPGVRKVPKKYKIEQDTIFIACGFAASRLVFSEQMVKIINVLFDNKNIKQVYIRCYDQELTRMLMKVTSCGVIHKNSSWTSLIIKSIDLKMLYTAFKSSPCTYSKQCDVRACYEER